MAVVEVDSDRVVSDRLEAFGAKLFGPAAGGEDGQRIPVDLLAEFSGICGWAHPAEPCRRIEDAASVGPLDGETLIAIEVKVAGRHVDGHGGMVRSGAITR